MIKTVNLHARVPVALKSNIITGNRFSMKLDVEDIRTLIMRKVTVDEVLEDGTTIRLDLKNYMKENKTKAQLAKEAAEAERIAKEAEAKAEAEKAAKEAAAKAEAERAAKEAEAKAEAERIAKLAEIRAATEAENRKVKAAQAKAAIDANKNK